MESLNNFHQLMLTFAEKQDNLEPRKKIRELLGLTPAAPIVFFGEQPHMLGGQPKSIAKSLCGTYLKLRDEDIHVVHYILSSDFARSEKDIYLARFPGGSRGKGIGIPRKSLTTNVAARNVRIKSRNVENITFKLKELAGSYKQGIQHAQLYNEVHDNIKKSINRTLSDMNIIIGRKIRNYLGLDESTVLEDYILETQLFLSDIGRSVLLHWPEMKYLANKYANGIVKPMDPTVSPIWIFSGKRETISPVMIDNKIHIENQAYEYEELCSAIEESGWQVCFRAIPKIFALSAVFDGLITGGGSHYMKIVSNIAGEMSADIFPFIPSGGLLRNYITKFDYHGPIPESIVTICQQNRFCSLDMLFSLTEDVIREEIDRFLNLDDFTLGRDDYLLEAV